MKINCPHCQQKYDYNKNMEGDNINCHACGRQFALVSLEYKQMIIADIAPCKTSLHPVVIDTNKEIKISRLSNFDENHYIDIIDKQKNNTIARLDNKITFLLEINKIRLKDIVSTVLCNENKIKIFLSRELKSTEDLIQEALDKWPEFKNLKFTKNTPTLKQFSYAIGLGVDIANMKSFSLISNAIDQAKENNQRRSTPKPPRYIIILLYDMAVKNITAYKKKGNKIICPYCQKEFEWEHKYYGCIQQCPYCQKDYYVEDNGAIEPCDNNNKEDTADNLNNMPPEYSYKLKNKTQVSPYVSIIIFIVLVILIFLIMRNTS